MEGNRVKRDHRNPNYQPTHHPHGTLAAYTHGHCRCDTCRTAWRDHRRKTRATEKTA